MSNIVRNYTGRVIACGGTVTVYGSCFSNLTRAWLDNEELELKDYDYDYVEFIGLSVVGEYVLFIGFSLESRLEVGPVEIRELQNLHIYKPNIPAKNVENNVDEARDALLGLLPRGFAWYKGLDGNFAKLAAGLSPVVREIYRIAALFKKSISPSHTDSFVEWENELRLPESGVELQNFQRRREEIFRKACRKGGVAIPYFKSIAALFNVGVNIYEYWKPEHRSKFEGVDFGEDDPNFYWMIEIEARSDDWKECTCNDTCNDYLQEWWNVSFEALFDAIKPAHTKLIYAYYESEQEFVIVDDGGDVVVTPSNTPIAAVVMSGHVVNPGTAIIDGHEVETIRVKDLPDAEIDDGAFVIRDSDVGGTTKAGIVGDSGFDSLWDNTPADPADDDTNETEGD